MLGSLVMYWAVRTTLCSAFQSDTEQLPYQAVVQPFRMLSMVQMKNFLRILTLFNMSVVVKCQNSGQLVIG